MSDEQINKIQQLEATLNFLITPSMTRDQKIKALRDSYWRSHNTGYCEHIAGLLMGGIENGETKLHDLDCKHKWDVIRLLELLQEREE